MKGAVQTIPISGFGIVTVTNLGRAVTLNRQERNWSGIRLAGTKGTEEERQESMTLYGKLISTFSLIISAQVFLWLAIDTYANRSLVIDNMQALAKNGATSLAISMGDVVARSEQTRLNVLFDAMAHLGPYSKLYFVDLDGNLLIERSFSNQDAGVPDLFQRLIQLPVVEARASVSKGWAKLGYVAVSIHPQQAYLQLWNALQQKLIWSLAIALAGIIGAIILIRSVLLLAQRSGR